MAALDTPRPALAACGGLPAGWSCPGELDERDTITVTTPDSGGALCCRDQ